MRIFVALIFASLPCLAYAQQGFINNYDFEIKGLVFTNMVLEGDTIIVSGIAVDDSVSPLQAILLAKLDTNGVLLDYTLHYDSLGSSYSFGATPRGLLKLSDGSGYILLAHAFQRSNGVAIKLDRNGEAVWVREYEDDNSLQDLYRKIIEVPDGFMIIGRKQMQNGNTKIFAMRTDYGGNMIWEKYYGESNRDYNAENILMINENEFIIGGNSGPAQNVPWQNWSSRLHVFSVDSLGNENWRWEENTLLEEFWIIGLHLDKDNNWVYTTTRGEFEFDGFLKRQPKFMMRDGSFNIIVDKPLDDMDGQSNFFLNMIPLTNGDWLGVGINYEEVPEPNIATSHGYAWMSRISPYGDTIWSRKDLVLPDTGYATGQYLHSAVELPSSIIIAAGYYKGNLDPKDRGVLIKVNSDGCVEVLDCPPLYTGIRDLKKSMDVNVYPNPVRSMLHFESPTVPEWDRVEVFDINGRKIMEGTNRTDIQMDRLINGVYLVRLWNGNELVVRRVVKK